MLPKINDMVHHIAFRDGFVTLHASTVYLPRDRMESDYKFADLILSRTKLLVTVRFVLYVDEKRHGRGVKDGTH